MIRVGDERVHPRIVTIELGNQCQIEEDPSKYQLRDREPFRAASCSRQKMEYDGKRPR